MLGKDIFLKYRGCFDRPMNHKMQFVLPCFSNFSIRCMLFFIVNQHFEFMFLNEASFASIINLFWQHFQLIYFIFESFNKYRYKKSNRVYSFKFLNPTRARQKKKYLNSHFYVIQKL